MIGKGPAIGCRWVNLFWDFEIFGKTVCLQIADFPKGPKFEATRPRKYFDCCQVDEWSVTIFWVYFGLEII